MLPVPTHLTTSIDLPSATYIDGCLTAKVQCVCGSETFELLYPGQTHEVEREAIPCMAEIDGDFFFRIEARCAHCARKHLLLDADFHGWEGFVCHDQAQAALPRPVLKPWHCLACQGAGHQARLRIQNEGEEDFLENTDGDFEASRWVDAFGWYSMDIACTKCGIETGEWVSYETM